MGAVPRIDRYVSTANLKEMRSGTRSQSLPVKADERGNDMNGNGKGHGAVRERKWEWKLLHGNGRKWESKTNFCRPLRYAVVVWTCKSHKLCMKQCYSDHYCAFKVGVL